MINHRLGYKRSLAQSGVGFRQPSRSGQTDSYVSSQNLNLLKCPADFRSPGPYMLLHSSKYDRREKLFLFRSGRMC